MTPVPVDPAAILPRDGRVARAPAPGEPCPPVTPVAGGQGGSTPHPVPSPPVPGEDPPSPQPSGRLAAGKPSPEAGAVRMGVPPAPARGRPQSPAGRTLPSSATPAGSIAIAAAMSEDRGKDSLEAHVRKLMKDLGLTGFHVEKSLDVEKNRKNVSVKGWPDWTIRGPRGVLFRELKSQRGRVEPEQQEWLDALTAAGADAGVWRPEDLLSERIQRELTAISGLRIAAGGAA